MDYIQDLDRLTRNKSDEVVMTTSAYKTLHHNLQTIKQNLERNQEAFATINRNNIVNEDLIKQMGQIVFSLLPKEKPKLNSKKTMVPFNININFEEELSKAPKSPLTPIPNLNELMGKFIS